MHKWPIVYDLDFKKIAILEHATRIGYERPYNGLWTASFGLPADDPKNALCRVLRYVEIFDNTLLGLFRILPITKIRQNETYVHYSLEHVFATLMDSTLFRYHEIGGTGTYTAEVLQYILSKQDVVRWQLGQVDFNRQFQYSWENENLLAALLSVPKPFDEDYRWTWATETYPWTLNLLKADNELGPEVRFSRNLKDLEYTEDPTNLCTRLYVLGQGEGVNQLGIEKVNPTGKPYVDADTIHQYGLVSKTWVDRRYEDEESLFESAKAALEQLKVPRTEISVSGADIYALTNNPIDQFVLGRPLKIIDIDLSVQHTSRVVKLSKGDVLGDPGNINIEIANQPQDIAGTIADLQNRSRINEVYSQGATNMDSHQMADNCDPTNPIIVKFHLSTDAVHINKAYLNYEMSAFRAYSKGAAAGGAVATTTDDGGSTTQTSKGGGGFSTTTDDGGSTTQTSKAGDRHSHTVDVGGKSSYVATWSSPMYSEPRKLTGWSLYNFYDKDGKHLYHRHGHDDQYIRYDNYRHHYHNIDIGSVTSRDESSHKHDVSIPNHRHNVSVSDHKHDVSIPNHRHSFALSDHVHDIIYGIYQGPTPTAVTVKVDGNVISGLGLKEEEVNIMDHLKRDAGGKIVRGFHEVTITPNSLGRANVVIHIQQFIQSKGAVRI